MTYASQDAHRRSAALTYDKPEVDVSTEERRHGKALNVLAAHGHLGRVKLLADVAGVDEGTARDLRQLFRERVLGVTGGVDGD